ncbi:CD99 molecule isoform X2 [Pangasianodon hypophthalmus]|uniref:CD99 molecule isoform X2 n=1 Tax=Pangasianodon hypophthalmus TaxID=310915 RepID=UPI000F008F56|nr:CD99 molecule isoform X2 [Pangasianodon hypophthalmus]
MTSYLWILLFGVLVITKAQDLSLSDALDDDDDKPPTSKPEQKPPKTGGDGLDLADALLPDPKKPDAEDPVQPVVPPKGGGGFSDTDLEEAGNDGYNPDVNPGGRSRGSAGDIPDTQDDNTKELYQQWLKLLTLLGDNLPEGLLAWIANSKQVVVSLLEKLLELLDLAEAEKQS